jgi:hypothetical protein
MPEKIRTPRDRVEHALGMVEWAKTLLEESETPEALDVDKLAEMVRSAFAARKDEAIIELGVRRYLAGRS